MNKYATLLIIALIGSALTANKCKDNSVKCTACTGTGTDESAWTCTKCYNQWSDSGACKDTTANCVEGASATTCSRCAQGYALKLDDNTCFKLTAKTDCASYTIADNTKTTADSTCVDCLNGKAMTGGACTGTGTVTDCMIEAAAGTCIACATTHFLTGTDTCTTQTDALKGCAKAASTSATKCDVCDGTSSYWMQEPGKCTKAFARIASAFALIALFFANF